MQIPATPADITAQGLTAVLRESGTIRNSAVESVHVEPVAAGSGFVGQTARLKVTYDCPEPGAPTALFAKLSSANPEVREQFRVIGLYETEAGFYRDLSEDLQIGVPKAYAVLYDPRTGESLLLLEDIGHLRFGDNLAGSTPEEARGAIGDLARMQAHYWNGKGLERCAWLRDAFHDLAGLPSLYRAMVPVFAQRWAAIAPPALLYAAQALAEWMEAWLESHTTGPLTLAHGDFRPDNFAFDESGELRLFDWQTARRHPGSRDLAYFLTFSLPIEVRRVRERELLELYHRSLQQAGVRDYSFDEVLRNHRRSIGSPIVTCVIAGGMLDFSNERATKLLTSIVERVGAAAQDHDFASWKPERRAHRGAP